MLGPGACMHVVRTYTKLYLYCNDTIIITINNSHTCILTFMTSSLVVRSAATDIVSLAVSVTIAMESVSSLTVSSS